MEWIPLAILVALVLVVAKYYRVLNAIRRDIKADLRQVTELKEGLEYLFTRLEERLDTVEKNIVHNENVHLRELVDGLLKKENNL